MKSANPETEKRIIWLLTTVHIPLSRDEICNNLDLPRTTVFDALERMKRNNMPINSQKVHRKRGRGNATVVYFLSETITRKSVTNGLK